MKYHVHCPHECALLVVDASRAEAQTVAKSVIRATLLGVEVALPVLNHRSIFLQLTGMCARQEIEDVIGIDASHAILASAKSGIGVEDILKQSLSGSGATGRP